MIERYTRPELGALWTDHARMDAWRRVEVAAAEELPPLLGDGRGPTPAELEAIREASFTVEAVNEREKETDHDVAAFVDVLAASAGPAGRWLRRERFRGEPALGMNHERRDVVPVALGQRELRGNPVATARPAEREQSVAALLGDDLLRGGHFQRERVAQRRLVNFRNSAGPAASASANCFSLFAVHVFAKL